MDGCSEEKDKKEAQRVLLMVQCVLDTATDQNGKKDLALARRHVNDALRLGMVIDEAYPGLARARAAI